MRDLSKLARASNSEHLSPEDFYRYVSAEPGSAEFSEMELHLTECQECREELAGLLTLLKPESDATAPPEPNPAELAETYSIIQELTRDEQAAAARLRRWRRWIPAAAAAAVVFIAGGWGLRYLSEASRSREYLTRATTALEQVLLSESPSGLRTDLPFSPSATIRNAPDEDRLNSAETLFHQALAVKGGIEEAHLGLGAIYLTKSRFDKALTHFQAVLEANPSSHQALLGRGVVKYEQASESEDPVERGLLMKAALADFDSVLERAPIAAEASYNRIWILYDTGKHSEALLEIDRYLESDSLSIWSERLKELRTRIQSNDPDAVDQTVGEAAQNRDAAAFISIARARPGIIPGRIRDCLRRSLVTKDSAAADMRWAAERLESAYAASTGDKSYNRLLALYSNLTQERKARKRAADAEYERLRSTIYSSEPATVLKESALLKKEFLASGDIWRASAVDHLRGNCLYWHAEFVKAESEYQSALRLAKQSGALDLIAGAMSALISAYVSQGRLEESLQLARELEDLADAHDLTYWKRQALLSLAGAHFELDRLEESLKINTTELAYSYRLGSGIRQSSYNAALYLERLGRLEDASRFCDIALLAYQSEKESGVVHPPGIYLNLLWGRGVLAHRMGEWKEAEAKYKASLEGSLGKMEELEGRNRLGLADIYINQGRYEDAAMMLNRSLALASCGEFPKLEWQALSMMGRLHRKSGNHEDAIRALKSSIRVLGTLAGKTPSGESKNSFAASRTDPYHELVSILVHHRNADRLAAEYADRSKSIALGEHLDQRQDLGLRNGEVERVYSPLPDSCSAVEFFFTSEELFAFLIDSEAVQALTIDLDPERTRIQVEELLKSLEEKNIEQYSANSARLYEKLIAPILNQSQLNGVEVLLIFPDGPLHRLPFAALKNRQGRFLIQDYALSYAPSRSVFDYCIALDRSDAGSKERTVALLGGSSNLRSAGRELASIFHLYDGNAAFLNPEDIHGGGRITGGAEIIHFAGHAEIAAGKPALALSRGSKLFLIDAADIASWNLDNCRLAYLAGCNTGLGPQVRGSAPWGLVPALLGAGVPAMIVSLSPVDDAVTAELSLHFYSLLAEGSLSKAKALQQAQLALLKSKDPASAISWIPYVLIGDPL